MESNDPAGPVSWRRAVAVAVVAVLIQLPALAAPAVAQVAAAADRKIDAGLLALPDDKAVDFWVTFSTKADLRRRVGPSAGATAGKRSSTTFNRRPGAARLAWPLS